MKNQDENQKTSRVLNFELSIQILVVIIILGGLGYSLKKTVELESRLSKIEGKLENLSTSKNNTIKEPVNDINQPVREMPTNYINMNEDEGMENIELLPEFQINWIEGPEEKVVEIYKDEKIKFKEKMRKGSLIHLEPETRERCQIKTWWDNGSDKHEELWVNIVE